MQAAATAHRVKPGGFIGGGYGESATDDIQYLFMYVVCVNRHQLMRLFVWQ